MDRKNLIIMVLVVLVLILVFRRSRSTYTVDQRSKIQKYLPNDVSVYTFISDMAIAQLSGTDSLSSVNSMIDILNVNRPTPFVKFTSEADIDTMFKTAYDSGEAGLADRERAILHVIGALSVALAYAPGEQFVVVDFGADGKPSYTDEVVAESGKSIKDILTFGFNVIKVLYASHSGTRTTAGLDNVLSMINDILPSKYTKYTSFEEIGREANNAATAPSDRVKFFAKAWTIGAAYLSWLAENKWKLDLDWVPAGGGPAGGGPVAVPNAS
jgi:hypothetical protein